MAAVLAVGSVVVLVDEADFEGAGGESARTPLRRV
jgi:hypothetical protein